MDYPAYYELNFEGFENFMKFMGLCNPKVIASAQLSSQDVANMKRLLAEAVARHNEQVDYSNYYHVDLDSFGIQYAAFLNEKEEKIIWINGFTLKDSSLHNSDDTPYFESHAVFVLDGGNGYFDTTISLSTEETTGIQIHGSS